MSAIDDLTVQELRLLTDLPRCTVLRTWAQSHGLSEVKATRMLKLLEEKLGVKLAERSNKGIVSTAVAARVAINARDVLRTVDDLKRNLGENYFTPWERVLTVAGRGFLCTHFAPCFVDAVLNQKTSIGLQFVDVSPKECVASAKSGSVDFVLAFEEVALGKSWQIEEVGSLVWRVYGRAGHPLAGGTTTGELSKFRIGKHAFWDGEKIVSGEGMLNSVLDLAHFGFAAQTASTAAAIAAASDQLVCIPSIVAADQVQLMRLSEIPVRDLELISTTVYLWTNVAKVQAHTHKRVVANLSRVLR